MKTIIVWFRNDLRIHDHPALYTASQDADRIVPLFIYNDNLLHGKHGSSNRNRFLLESLDDLQHSLHAVGANLFVRSGDPAKVLQEIASQVQADAVYYSADYTPYAVKRDRQIKHSLQAAQIGFRSFGGRLIVDQMQGIKTKNGDIFKVFTPFWKNWMAITRRPVADTPKTLAIPDKLAVGVMPKLSSLTNAADLSEDVVIGGEKAGRARMKSWLKTGVNDYHNHNDQMAADGTSRLSSYLHFGCISARELEAGLADISADTAGARAYNRQLCWRDFYNYILFHFPANASKEFQERFRDLSWGYDAQLLEAWQTGHTGYPVVDAAMRQLRTEGWMHNRARLIVGSFLTKDLGLDWRLGEAYFMRMLLDGDEANNNGNWQWIASVGVDPAPVFRRLYNPTLQQKKFDTDGVYVRRYVAELAKVPKKYLAEPWTMPVEVQQQSNCIITNSPSGEKSANSLDNSRQTGQHAGHYPGPIVDHPTARQAALERYHTASTAYTPHATQTAHDSSQP